MILIFFLLLIVNSEALESNTIRYDKPGTCSSNSSYNPVKLSCVLCSPSSVSRDLVSCRCKAGYYTLQDTGFYMGSLRDRQGGLGLSCGECGAGLVTSQDGRMCLKCQQGIDPGTKTCLPCPDDHIQIERDQSGQLLPEITCLKCSPGSKPDSSRKYCIPCTQLPLLPNHNIAPQCSCTTRSGLCLPTNLDISDIYIESPSAYTIKYGTEEIQSTFLKDRMTVSAYMCGRQLNSTSCNLLANLCTLTGHRREHPACSTLKRIADRNNDQTSRRVPVLFLPGGQSLSTLESEAILSTHSLRGRKSNEDGSHRLNLTVARYSDTGEFLSLDVVEGNVFHLCNVSSVESDAAWEFGTRYKKTCKLPASELWKMRTEFYDLYYPFTSKLGNQMLYTVFSRILDGDTEQEDEEEEQDMKNWELTSRFFLVDNVGASQGPGERPKFVRYLAHMDIVITLLNTRKNPDKPGRIHPPVVKLRYKEVSLEDAERGQEVEMTFAVSYRMDMKRVEKDVEIAVGVMSALAVLLSAVEAWSWSKRSGKVGVDAKSLLKLIVSTAGNLSHIFLAVIFFSSLYWFIFFKQQTFVHTLLPAQEQETFIKQYLISAFSLKLVDVVVLILGQVTVDVFLLDWERPPPSGSKVEEEDPPVSVWRTYLVANEWNEIQTRRKTNISLQVICFLILMKVCGMENLSTADPHNRLWPEEGKYMAEHSYVCRFALGICVWGLISVVQAFFWVVVYNGVVEDKLAQFTDICSLSNISVFVMSHSHFGYYIHGKSAHGTADTNMAGLLEQLQREADDLCGHRGLQAGSDHQTFSMTLPLTLRSYYDKVVVPASKSGGNRQGRMTGTVLQNMVHAYTTMNRFLTRFLEHALKDMDYEVKEKNFLESVLDIEFHENTGDKAVLYTDNGHSFDSLLLYGHEFTLTIWEILVMSFVDLLAQDFLLAAIITYFVSKFISNVRYILGRSNLATKTLIDKRFLI